LESALKSELGGCFENLMVALCLPLAEFMAREVHHAISGIGTNEGTLIEILCSGTNQDIREMNAAYQQCENSRLIGLLCSNLLFVTFYSSVYGHPMENDIKGDTSGEFELLLVSLVQVNFLLIWCTIIRLKYELIFIPFNSTCRVKEMRIRRLMFTRLERMPIFCFKQVVLLIALLYFIF
jgi:hypothetical protein